MSLGRFARYLQSTGREVATSDDSDDENTSSAREFEMEKTCDSKTTLAIDRSRRAPNCVRVATPNNYPVAREPHTRRRDGPSLLP